MEIESKHPAIFGNGMFRDWSIFNRKNVSGIISRQSIFWRFLRLFDAHMAKTLKSVQHFFLNFPVGFYVPTISLNYACPDFIDLRNLQE